MGVGAGGGDSVFHAGRASVREGETVLETDGGDAHTAGGVRLIPRNCVLEMTKMVIFMICVFYHIF